MLVTRNAGKQLVSHSSTGKRTGQSAGGRARQGRGVNGMGAVPQPHPRAHHAGPHGRNRRKCRCVHGAVRARAWVVATRLLRPRTARAGSCTGSIGSAQAMTGAQHAKGGRQRARPELCAARTGDGPDLSISLRPGEETNVDSRSSGERTGRSPSGKPAGVVARARETRWNAAPERVRAPEHARGASSAAW